MRWGYGEGRSEQLNSSPDPDFNTDSNPTLDEEVAKDFGSTEKEMQRGMAAVGAASCFACFQKTTRWMYKPEELYKDHQLTAYFECVATTAGKYDRGMFP